MLENDYSGESPESWEQKCCCVLVLDVSGSMQGAPITELNQGLQEFYNEIKDDPHLAASLEVAIVEFSNEVKIAQQPSLVGNFTMPYLHANGSSSSSSSSSRLVDGVWKGISIAKDRKAWYKQTKQPYFIPWIFLITKGELAAGQDTQGLGTEISSSVAKKEFWFLAIGVQNANMKILTSISSPKFPPALLQGLKFTEFFKWLSASMSLTIK